MPMGKETEGAPNLAVTREPVGPKNVPGKKSMGDYAVNDAILVIVGAWVLLFVLSYSLRSHNI